MRKIFCCFVSCMLIFSCLSISFADNKPVLSDAFALVDIVFDGPNGNGTATVIPKTNAIDFTKINYILSDNSRLSNGDVVLVSVETDDYIVYQQQALFEVSGLFENCSALSDVSADVIDIINQDAYDFYSKLSEKQKDLNAQIVYMSPIKLIMVVENNNMTLYDVLDLQFQANDGTLFSDKYAVVCYQDVGIEQRVGGKFSYSSCDLIDNKCYLSLKDGIPVEISIESPKPSVEPDKAEDIELTKESNNDLGWFYGFFDTTSMVQHIQQLHSDNAQFMEMNVKFDNKSGVDIREEQAAIATPTPITSSLFG